MTHEEELTQFARELTDRGKLIEAGWIGLQLAIFPAGASRVQLVEMRKAFFAGAQHLFSTLLSILDPGAEPTDADLARMHQIDGELRAFEQEIRAELTKN